MLILGNFFPLVALLVAQFVELPYAQTLTLNTIAEKEFSSTTARSSEKSSQNRAAAQPKKSKYSNSSIKWYDYRPRRYVDEEEFDWRLAGLPQNIKTQIQESWGAKIPTRRVQQVQVTAFKQSEDFAPEKIWDATTVTRKIMACWAYAVSSLAEAMYSVQFHHHMSFSELELLYCYGQNDCNDRSVIGAMEYGYTYGFTPTQWFHPRHPCPSLTNYKFTKLFAIPPSEDSIKTYILNTGPVILHLFLPVQTLKNYMGTYILGGFDECKEKHSNHAMIAVGFGQDYHGNKYWILQNSWGIDWGENGYVKWRRGTNDCGIEQSPVGGLF